jgi:hypothetical protein
MLKSFIQMSVSYNTVERVVLTSRGYHGCKKCNIAMYKLHMLQTSI